MALASKICVLDRGLLESESIRSHAQRFGIPFELVDVNSINPGGIPEDLKDAIFVLEDFKGRNFDLLKSCNVTSIMGTTALKELATSGEEDMLYLPSKPLFCLSMNGMNISFSGYTSKDKLHVENFLHMIQSMGGRVVKDINKVNYLVSKTCTGSKYTYASTFDVPIMEENWITEAWKRRCQAGFVANEEKFLNEWKVKPFQGACIYFLGFEEDEKKDMLEHLIQNGGTQCETQEDPCSHIVVDERSIISMPTDVKEGIYLVKKEWFWASIQMDARADEKRYSFADHIQTMLSPRTTYFSPTAPGSLGKRKKRRTEAVRQLAQIDDQASTMKKARSSLSELCNLAEGSINMQDTPDKTKDRRSPKDLITSPRPEQNQIKSGRLQVFEELVETEENYVGILKTIVHDFKEPLEDLKLLNQTQLKIIFGNVPPLLTVHQNMLGDLRYCLRNWKENCSVGNLILKHTDTLLKSYPPFVNFFEDSKKTLEECDRNIPRFHAFLKVAESKASCGRQTLAQIMIGPVQRLGRIDLLLSSLLKQTRKEKGHPDEVEIEKALAKVKEVLKNINEDKRKTEDQVHMFEIFNDIEDCPPDLVSAQRNFLCKVDVMVMGGSEKPLIKAMEVTLFLFSDLLVVTKKRRNAGRNLGLRSPSTMSLRNVGLTNPAGGASINQLRKPYRHIEIISLNSIRRVVDLIDGEECRDCFALICKSEDFQERIFVLQLATRDEISKMDIMNLLCRHIANAMYRYDPNSYLVRRNPDALALTSSDFVINKNYRSFNRVKKALSFNRTPTANRLTKTVSTMFSPLAYNEHATK